LKENVGLRKLELSVMGGDPGIEEAESVPGIEKEDFEVMMRMRREWGAGDVDLEWVQQLMQIRGLRQMDVKALVEACMAPRSGAMRFWVAFSKSVEGGFADWVRGVMVQRS
jgi:hypothetical protein